MKKGGEIPEGHYESENMRKTVVPGRNLIMLSIMAGIAESEGASFVGIGVHSGDHHIYPDCRHEFIKSADTTIFLSSDRKVHIDAPFIGEDKASILEMGYSYNIKVPYHLTRTCYKDQIHSCGKCGSCSERLEAFYLIGKEDPITYAPS
jgi:7-cyano-7-deazaguanine synthase